MGGYGSGPYGAAGSWIAKAATSACYALDIRMLKRKGGLQAGLYYTWSWTNNKGGSANIRIHVPDETSIVLGYHVTIDGESKALARTVRLAFSECNYGSRRKWFCCPGCSKRVAIIYLRGSEFKCRHCHDLTYYSCQESGNFNDMAMRRVNKVLAKLKSDERCSFDIIYYTPPRPRYMHRKTYRRLLARYDRKRREYAASVRVKLDSFDCNAREVIGVPEEYLKPALG